MALAKKAKSNYISLCIIVQNRKKWSIYTIWAKKHPHQLVHNYAFMHNYYSNHAYMHSYCSMCILYFNSFWFASFFSLSSPSAKLTLPLMFSFPLIPYAPTDTKSKINYKNQKSTTKSTKKKKSTTKSTKKNRPQNQQKKSITGTKSLDRWCWWKSVMGWCWSVLMEIDDGLTKISVDGVLIMGWWRRGKKKILKKKKKKKKKKERRI